MSQPAPPATAKRYHRLLVKVQQWQPACPSDPLLQQQQQLLALADALPPVSAAAVSNNQLSAVEAFLRQAEDFLRPPQADGGRDGQRGPAEGGSGSGDKLAKPAATAGTGSGAEPTEEAKTNASFDAGDRARRQVVQSLAGAVAKDAVVSSTVQPLPAHIVHRIQVWDRVAARPGEAIPPRPIVIRLPDGKQVVGAAGVTTPLAVAQQLSQPTERWLIAKVDDRLWDLTAPLLDDCALSLLDFDSKEGSHTFWHSSAHLLGQAVEAQYGDVRLCVGPPLDDGGFYYDVEMGDHNVSPVDFARLETAVRRAVSEEQPFTRLVLSKDEALEMFRYNRFKQDIIRSKVADGDTCTAYRCGPLIDLCRGPHVPNSSYVRAMAVTKASSSYWLGQADQPSLQRVYGMSFPSRQQLVAWQDFQRQAEERDHRKVGVQQKLFFFHEWSPGSCFFLPHGARVYNRLCQFVRSEYARRGYSEVISPNVYNIELWKKSGHYDNYKENMFLFQCEHDEYALKPMNCSDT
jgi:threonyl-tRNA synthetase